MLLSRPRIAITQPATSTKPQRAPLARKAAAPKLSQFATAKPQSHVARASADFVSVDEQDYMVGPMFARGSYGSLHRAVDVDHPGARLVAKKMLVGKNSASDGPRMFQRSSAEKIQTEIAVMRAVQSPLRPKSVDVGEEEATLVMPYCDGDLEAVKPGPSLPEQTRRDMLRSAVAQTAQELAHMHSVGYMHLDIKPANMFFTRTGDVCMGDYGLSHPFEAGKALNMRRGSPAMMAPEALINRSLTPKGETWSLFSSWLDMAVGSENNAFVTEPTHRLPMWRLVHGAQPFGRMMEAQDGPFSTTFEDFFTWQEGQHGTLDASKLANEKWDPISQTFAKAAAFDPEMTALGLNYAMRENPAERMGVDKFGEQVRAIQPIDSRAEASARSAFAELAEANEASKVEYADLRREASKWAAPAKQVTSPVPSIAWTGGMRRAFAF